MERTNTVINAKDAAALSEKYNSINSKIWDLIREAAYEGRNTLRLPWASTGWDEQTVAMLEREGYHIQTADDTLDSEDVLLIEW